CDLQAVAGRQDLHHFIMRERHGRANRNLWQLNPRRRIDLYPLPVVRETKEGAQSFELLSRGAWSVFPRSTEFTQHVQIKLREHLQSALFTVRFHLALEQLVLSHCENVSEAIGQTTPTTRNCWQ